LGDPNTIPYAILVKSIPPRSIPGRVKWGVAVYLVMAIIVIPPAILYTHPTCGFDRDEVTPSVHCVYQPFRDNDSAIHIEKVDPDAVPVNLVRFILLDEAGRAIVTCQGNVLEITNLSIHDPRANVSFHDNDRDKKISAGDVFIIRSKKNGGQAMERYSLLLKFEITGDKMNGGGTILG